MQTISSTTPSSVRALVAAPNGRNIPLKLHLGKKSGRYDLSQEVYVLSVNIDDRPVIQCTLTTESTGWECIDYLRHKKDLNQSAMFGLRFQMRSNDPDERLFRWVEMDKSLRRQLDKWACKPRQVELAVLYHTPNAFILTDLMARSFYFALMKLDVVKGRLTIDMDTYISLAAHSLQAEYGDYDKIIHSTEFMQSIPLLPKHIYRSATILEDLLKHVAQSYQKLQGMKEEYAALMYIVEVMRCEGYGEEYFRAKDEDSSEVRVGYSPDGIVVKGADDEAPLRFRWEEMKEITSHKRYLTIKRSDGIAATFSLEDAERARYVCTVLNWQFHYATHAAITERNANNDINDLQGGFKALHHVSNNEVNRLNSSQPDIIAALHSQKASSSAMLHSTNTLHKPSFSSLTNVHAVTPAEKKPLSSVSFRDPVNVYVPDDRPRAATSAFLPSPVSTSASTQPSGFISSAPNLIAKTTWHPNMINDQSASYKFLFPNAVEIGEPIRVPVEQPVQPPQRKILGSSPEMRLLGVNPSLTNDIMKHVLREHNMARPSFQSAPNLIDQVTLAALSMNIPPEPLQLATGSQLQITAQPEPQPAKQEELLPQRSPVSAQANTMPTLEEDPPQPGPSTSKAEVKEVADSDIGMKLASPIEAMNREFLMIRNKRPSACTLTAIKPENLHRNRTRCILPYEDNRVRLKTCKKNPCGYINASKIEVPINDQKLQYIVAQAPMRDTVDDFWAAIWETKSLLVVMLSEATLDAAPNAPIYWPANANSKVETRDLEIKFNSMSASEHEVTTMLQLRHVATNEKRTVYHMRFVGWPLGGVPSESHLLAFMESVASMFRHINGTRTHKERVLSSKSHRAPDPPAWRKRLSLSIINITHSSHDSSDSSDSGAPPSPSATCKNSPPATAAEDSTRSASASSGPASPALFLHCYNGAHESGVYLLADVLIFSLEHNLTVNVPELLASLRDQRMSLIKNIEQYRFVHSLLKLYLSRSRLI